MTRAIRGRPSRFTHEVMLITCSMAKDRALELLQGFASPYAARVRALAGEHLQQAAKVRRARVAMAFSPSSEMEARLRRLLETQGPGLQQALIAAAPPYLRPPVEDATVAGRAVTPVVRAWAARLVQECAG